MRFPAIRGAHAGRDRDIRVDPRPVRRLGGESTLRAALAAYLGRVRGVRTTADQVVICAGLSQGLALLCRTLARRGVRRIAVEDPCFRPHRMITETAGLEAVPVPVSPDGLEVTRLAGLGDVGAVLLPPDGTRGAVAEAAARCGLHLEDATWHWADREAAPPSLLIGYGAARESALMRGIETLGASVQGPAHRCRAGAPSAPLGAGVATVPGSGWRDGQRGEVVIQYRQRPLGRDLPGGGDELEAQPVE